MKTRWTSRSRWSQEPAAGHHVTTKPRANNRWSKQRKDAWQEHRWLVRPDDWNGGTIPPTVLYSPEDLSRQLDHKDDGTPFVAQVDTEQHAVDCLNMLAGALDGQGTIVLTNVCAKDVDGFGEELRSWATSAQRTTVFGKLGVQISGRMCWLIGFGESPPQMRSKVASPFKPIALDRESDTLRSSYQWH